MPDLLAAKKRQGQDEGHSGERRADDALELDPDQFVDHDELFGEDDSESGEWEEDQVLEKMCGWLLGTISSMEAEADEPIWLRAQWRLARAKEGLADDVASIWRESLRLAGQGRWRRAAELFGQLIDIVPDVAELWWNKGLCLARYGNFQDAAEAIRRYAALVEDEADALDAEALAISLLEAAEPTTLACKASEFKVLSRAKLTERLTGSPRVGREEHPDGSPAWILLDRPQSPESEPQVHFMIAFAKLAENGVRLIQTTDKGEEVKQLFLEIAGDSIDVNSEQAQEICSPLLYVKFEPLPWLHGSTGTALERRNKVQEQYRANYERYWADARFNYLEGKTPREAYQEPSLRRRVRAALWSVEHRFLTRGQPVPRLREQLGIDPEPSWHLNGRKIEQVPPSRLISLCLDDLEQDTLKGLLSMGHQYAMLGFCRRAALTLLERAERGEGGVNIAAVFEDAAAGTSRMQDVEQLYERARRIAGDNPKQVVNIELAHMRLLSVLDQPEAAIKKLAYLFGLTKELGGEHLVRFLELLLQLGLARPVEQEGSPGSVRLDIRPLLDLIGRYLDQVGLGELDAKKLRPKLWTPNEPPAGQLDSPGDKPKPKIWTPDG